MDSWIGRIVGGQFRLEQRIGLGGMGAVYVAEQIGMKRKVIVKVMLPELAEDRIALERFRREAQAIAQLNHPNIVQVFVFGEDQGIHFIAMEFVDGRDLATAIRESAPMPAPRVLKIAAHILAALDEAHKAGIIHRDLKPNNIRLTTRLGNPDFAKVLDFGLVKNVDEIQAGEGLTQIGRVVGTPAYMSPEQARAGRLDGRSDLYALGVIMYQMLTGHHPFRAHSSHEFMVKHSSEPIVPPSRRFPDIDVHPEVEMFVMSLLAKSRDGRPADAEVARNQVLRLVTLLGEAPAPTGVSSVEMSARYLALESNRPNRPQAVTEPLERKVTRPESAPDPTPIQTPEESVDPPTDSRAVSPVTTTGFHLKWYWWLLIGAAGALLLTVLLLSVLQNCSDSTSDSPQQVLRQSQPSPSEASKGASSSVPAPTRQKQGQTSDRQ